LKDDLLKYAVLQRVDDFSELQCLLYAAVADMENERKDMVKIGGRVGDNSSRVYNAIIDLGRVISNSIVMLEDYVTQPAGQDPGCMLPTD